MSGDISPLSRRSSNCGSARRTLWVPVQHRWGSLPYGPLVLCCHRNRLSLRLHPNFACKFPFPFCIVTVRKGPSNPRSHRHGTESLSLYLLLRRRFFVAPLHLGLPLFLIFSPTHPSNIFFLDNFNSPIHSETMSNGFRPGSSSDLTTTPSVLPALAGRRLSGSLPQFVVEKIGEYPLGLGSYSDVWKAKMTRECGATSLVCVSFSLLLDHF